METLRQGPRLRLSELFATESTSPYYTNRTTRQRFDAQAWGLMQYVLFGRPEDRADRVNQLVKRLLEGQSSAAAIQEVFGSIEALDKAYLLYFQQPVIQYARLKVEAKTTSKSFASRRLTAPESAAARAGFHAAMDRPVEARVLMAEARKGALSAPGSYEVEALLLDREDKDGEARTALSKAEELNSENFYVHYRLATLDWSPNPDAAALAGLEKKLRRSVALNDAYPPALAMLADVLADGDQPADALELAKKAVSLDPGEASWRMSLARALWALSRNDEAKAQAGAALTLARTDAQRKSAQSLIDFFARAPGPGR